MESNHLSIPIPTDNPTISGGGQTIGEPFSFSLEDYEGALLRSREARMARVVIVRDLADKLGRDRSSFTKLLRKSEIELLKVRDPKTDQMVLAVLADDVEEIKSLLVPGHEIVDPSELF